MDPTYAVANASGLPSPALLFYPEIIRQNIARAVEMAGGPDRLRPHVKTHKTAAITRMALAAGITRHKCATLAEAEMLARCGAPDVLIAYPLVGPNAGRLAGLVAAHPGCRFATLVDHPKGAAGLSAALSARGASVDVLLDLNVGQNRTGIPPGDAAAALYETLARLRGLKPAGLHAYDGHNNPPAFEDRRATAGALLETVLSLRRRLEARGLPVPRIVVAGTPSFPAYAGLEIPGLECSPGTFFLYDHGYRNRFSDLGRFTPAAALLTRVVSRPNATRVTLDVGTKAVASDPPAGGRCHLLGFPEYQAVLHNEEHLVVETEAADRYAPGDEVYAIPTHVCPTVALHRFAHVVENGRVTRRWEIDARDRLLAAESE